MLGLVARGEYKADVAVLVECGAESFLPHIAFLASVFNVAADLDIADIEELKFLRWRKFCTYGTAELSVAAVSVVVNGVRLKSGCGHFVYALTRVQLSVDALPTNSLNEVMSALLPMRTTPLFAVSSECQQKLS